MNLFTVELRDVGEPILQPWPEGRCGVGVVEYIFGHEGQIDPAKKQKISQAFHPSRGVNGNQAKIGAPAECSRHVMRQTEICGAGVSAQNQQRSLVVLLLQRLLLLLLRRVRPSGLRAARCARLKRTRRRRGCRLPFYKAGADISARSWQRPLVVLVLWRLLWLRRLLPGPYGALRLTIYLSKRGLLFQEEDQGQQKDCS